MWVGLTRIALIVVGNLWLGVDAVQMDRAHAVEAATGCNQSAVVAVVDAENSPRQRRQFPQQIGVVADHPLGGAMHTIDFGHAVGPAEQDFVPLRDGAPAR